MGIRHKVFGRVVVIKADRSKHGNGAKGGGRKNGTGREAALYEEDAAGELKLLVSVNGSSNKDAAQKLRAAAPGKIPPRVDITHLGETRF
jgi:hypothetical protein